jgi:hypothetical protein
MSFDWTARHGSMFARVLRSNGWSILATLISPMIAVGLTQYFHAKEKQHTTFAIPIPAIEADAPESQQPRPFSESVIREGMPKDSPKDSVSFWQAFPPKPYQQIQAKNLIEKARGMKDDSAGRLAALRLAKDMAAQAGDGATAFEAIDAMSEAFSLDGDAMKLAVLSKFASAANQPAQHKSIAEEALNLMDRATLENRFIDASRLGKLAVAEAKRTPDKDLLAQAQAQNADVARRVKAREPIAK